MLGLHLGNPQFVDREGDDNQENAMGEAGCGGGKGAHNGHLRVSGFRSLALVGGRAECASRGSAFIGWEKDGDEECGLSAPQLQPTTGGLCPGAFSALWWLSPDGNCGVLDAEHAILLLSSTKESGGRDSGF